MACRGRRLSEFTIIPAMSPDRTATIPSTVMARQLGDETVILDLASGTYFGLEAVGARFWQLLTEGRSLKDSQDLLLQEYEVDAATLEADLERLLADLAGRGLLTLA